MQIVGFPMWRLIYNIVSLQAGSSKLFGRSPVKDQPSPSVEYGLRLQFDGGRSIGRSPGSDGYPQGVVNEGQDEVKITGKTNRPPREKTNNLHRRKQRRRSASR